MNRRQFGRYTLGGAAALAFPATIRAAQPASGARAYRYVHLDVFTDRRLAGNQLLVFLQPAGLDADTMLAVTRESNFSECTFVFPPEQAGTDHRVRIFTRTAETPFAGHPTIGTVFALVHGGVLKPGATKTTFGLGVGPTNIDLEWKGSQLAFAWMTQLQPTFGKAVDDAGALAAAIGVEPSAVVRRKPGDTGRNEGVPAGQEVNCGSTFLIVPLATRKAVDAAALDRSKLDAILAATGIQRRGVYVVSTERGQDDATVYSRLLGTGGIEDPATGSAAGPAGCFLVKYGLLTPDAGSTGIVVLQGVQVRRPSRIHVRVAASGGEISGVKVGGTAVVVGEGTMTP